MADEQITNAQTELQNADPMVPGTYQIRKIASRLTPIALLEIAEHLATEGYDKKLFSLLSRVYTEHKGFAYKDQEGIKELIGKITASAMPSELKMQAYTSFEVPREYKPSTEVAEKWVIECAEKRRNIAAFFMASYGYGQDLYHIICKDRDLNKMFVEASQPEDILLIFEQVMEKEDKEFVTGMVRNVKSYYHRVKYVDMELVKRITEEVFSSRQVFFTSKILFCLAFYIPAECLPPAKDLYKTLKISVNYEEKITKDFVKRYHIDFDLSEEAMCRYYLGNKKSDNEKALVEKFAHHVVAVEDEQKRRKLIHGAFKRGGLFRMYAGCMQDGCVDEAKQKRFRYSDEQIAWVKTLPGLKKKSS